MISSILLHVLLVAVSNLSVLNTKFKCNMILDNSFYRTNIQTTVMMENRLGNITQETQHQLLFVAFCRCCVTVQIKLMRTIRTFMTVSNKT